MRDIRSRLAKGSMWISGARGATNLLSFVTTIVLARILVPSDFGLVALASTMLAILASVTDLSVSSALVQHKNPTEDHYHSAWTLGAARGCLLYVAIVLAAGPAARLYQEPRLDEVMYVLSLNVLIVGLQNPRLAMIQRKLVFWQTFILTVANSVVMAAVSIGIALIYQTYWALVLGAVAGQLTSTSLSYILFPFRPRPTFNRAGDLLSFSIWLSLSQGVNALNQRFDHLLVGGILGRAALGYYSVGSNLAVLPSREAVLPLTKTLFPAFSAVSRDLERLRRGYQRSQTLVTAIAMPAGIGFALIADPVVRLAMGEKWTSAIVVIQVISAVYAFSTLGSLAQPLAMATGATRVLFSRAVQLLILRVPMILLGMYLGGLLGLLYARAFVGAVGIVMNLHIVRSLTGLALTEQLRANLRCLTAVAAMAAGVLAVQYPLAMSDPVGWTAEIALSVGIGTSAYLGSSWLMWIMAGRPRGPETEAREMAMRLYTRMKNNGQPAANNKGA